MPSNASKSAFPARNTERVSIDSPASLHRQSLYAIEIRVRDVSTSGFMAECDDSIGIGSFVSLDVPGVGEVRAQVRWQIGTRMGGMFLDPISLDQCEWIAVKTDAA